ncbi:hypothetical protein ACP70R_040247 [Stipagrostis hirtigluma subsp. patula]
METGVTALTVVVGLSGVLSSVLGFIAEDTKLSADDITVSTSQCVYPSNPAFALGLCAVLLLAVAQITASAAGGCCGCCRPRAGAAESKRVMGIVCSVLSWDSGGDRRGVLLARGGVERAGDARKYSRQRVLLRQELLDMFQIHCVIHAGLLTERSGGPSPEAWRNGVFTRAAVLTLAAAVLGIKSCILLSRTPAPAAGVEPKPEGQYPAAVGLPQWPAQGYAQAPYPHAAQGYVQAPNPHFAPAPPQGKANALV